MNFCFLFPLLMVVSWTFADREFPSSISGRGGSRLVGGDRCTWGPSYWCHHIKNAKQCSAVSHCVQTVWMKHTEPDDNSPVCRWCDALMDDIRGLMSNTSKSGMLGYLKDGCKRIPDREMRATCMENVATDLVEVMEMLRANVPDRTICKTIGFCAVTSSPEDDALEGSPKLKTTPLDRDYCEDCHNFFEDAKELYIGNYTEDEFKQMLLQSCEQAGYPAITELCKTVIEEYWPQIYARLQMFFDPDQVCYQLNFCNTSRILTAADKWTVSILTPKKLRSLSTPLVQLTSSRKTSENGNLPLVALRSAQPQALPIERMLLNIGGPSQRIRAPRPAKGEWTDVECVVCEFVMSYVDRMLEDNYTEAAIQSALDRVCGVMPSSVRNDCQSFVDQYAPAILVILGNELDPAQVCQGLQLCSSGKKVKVCGGTSCTACTEVFQAIKTLLEDYPESERLAKLVQGYCNYFPGDAKVQCQTAVVTYFPYVLQMAAQLLNPDATCRAFKLCPV